MLTRFLAATVLLTCFTSLASAELVSHWPFEDFPDELTTPDVVSGFDLEVLSETGNFDSANHVDGKIGKAFEFFGEDQTLLYRTHNEGDLLPINLQPEWTISMWAKVEGTGQNDLRLFSESNTMGDNNPLFNIGTANNGGDGSLDIYIRNSALSTPTVNHPHTTAHPFNDEWSHIGWTFADGTHTIWIDGVQEEDSYAMESFGAIEPNIDTTTVGGILRGASSHWVTGVIDEVAIWNEVLPGSAIAGLASEATTPMEALDFEGTLPPFAVGGRGEIGSDFVAGTRENQLYGPVEGDLVPGLGQSWYAVANPGSKAGVDAIAEGNDRAVPYFHGENGTWWSGSDVVSDVQQYPTEVEGVITGDNYTVKLDGEILIEESGLYRFLDGVDDYTYLAIDTDKSGVAGDSEDEVLIDDNAWTNALSTGNGGAPIVEVDIDVEDGGEWLAMEFNMAEGGGGDHGMLYWDYDPESDDGIGGHDFFPIDQGEGVVDEDAVIFQVPDSHLRGPENPAPLVSADITGEVPSRESGWEIDVNPEDGMSDAFALENPDADVFTTILDVDGIEFHINPMNDVSEGDSFTFLLADSITGTPMIVTEGWVFDPVTGSVSFGNPCIPGDIDCDGTVGFPDFLVLSANFGMDVEMGTLGDIDGDGNVGFPDFLVLSSNFGNMAGAQAVPEPSCLALLGMAGLFGGLARRRRR